MNKSPIKDCPSRTSCIVVHCQSLYNSLNTYYMYLAFTLIMLHSFFTGSCRISGGVQNYYILIKQSCFICFRTHTVQIRGLLIILWVRLRTTDLRSKTRMRWDWNSVNHYRDTVNHYWTTTTYSPFFSFLSMVCMTSLRLKDTKAICSSSLSFPHSIKQAKCSTSSLYVRSE